MRSSWLAHLITVDAIRRLQRLKTETVQNMGVDLSQLVIVQPQCGEDAFGILRDLINTNSFAVIVVDSVSALVPKAEIEGDVGQAQSKRFDMMIYDALDVMCQYMSMHSSLNIHWKVFGKFVTVFYLFQAYRSEDWDIPLLPYLLLSVSFTLSHASDLQLLIHIT